jgi:hypothetical protein
VEVVGIALAKNGQVGWCFDELDKWGWGMFGEIRACGSGFRTEETIVRDFVRGERWVVPEEGLNDRSQAIYCLGCVQKGRPSRRDGVIKSDRTFFLH